jgi:hypothetical protein
MGRIPVIKKINSVEKRGHDQKKKRWVILTQKSICASKKLILFHLFDTLKNYSKGKKMLKEFQLKSMLLLQLKNQVLVHPEWHTKGWPFLRAVVVEGSEGIEHAGWKWWKAQQMDLAQTQLEVIDIWHFYLSDALVDCGVDVEKTTKVVLSQLQSKTGVVMFDGKAFDYTNMSLIEKFELLIGLSVVRRKDWGLFESLLSEVNLDWGKLFRLFVGKNALNQFRQLNGYKEGTYKKEWHGEEDNVHLTRILSEINESDDFIQQVFDALAKKYQTVVSV